MQKASTSVLVKRKLGLKKASHRDLWAVPVLKGKSFFFFTQVYFANSFFFLKQTQTLT